MKTIKIHIQKDGSVKVETNGFAGQACENATKALEKALGTVGDRKHTDEYYVEDTTVNRMHINGN